MDIYKVTVCKFEDAGKNENICRLIYDDYTEHYCAANLESGIAVDIYTLEEFCILKKDSKNRILASEAPKINIGQSYGVDIEKIDLRYLPLKERTRLQLQYLRFIAIMAMLRHFDNAVSIPSKDAQKVIKR